MLRTIRKRKTTGNNCSSSFRSVRSQSWSTTLTHLSSISRTQLLSSLNRFTLCSPRGNWCHQLRSMKLCNRARTQETTPKALPEEEMTSATSSRRMTSRCPKRMASHWLEAQSMEPTKEAALRSLWPLKVHQKLLPRNWKLPTTRAWRSLTSTWDRFNKVSLKSGPKRKWAACTRKEISMALLLNMVDPLSINSYLCLKDSTAS